MNLMGKILTFFILIMSIGFLILSVMVGVSHRAWKQAATENKQKAALAQTLLNDARNSSSEIERLLANERVSRQQQLQQLFSELAIERQNRDNKEKELARQLVIATEQLEILKNTESRIAQQDSDIEKLKQDNKGLIDEIAQKRTQIVALTNDINNRLAELEILEKRTADLSDEVATWIRIGTQKGFDTNTLTATIPPKVEAIVVEVKDEFFVIEIGTDDGLRQGHTLDIYRGKKFIGKAVVRTSDHSSSVLEIDPGYLQTAVRKGDHVTTKL